MNIFAKKKQVLPIVNAEFYNLTSSKLLATYWLFSVMIF